ncbi:MAG: 60S ribosomal protein L31 [Methanobacteriota archaeon]|nr:MAG: 60S ribosomal protein L31 [Euryarchaeota archaeon]
MVEELERVFTIPLTVTKQVPRTKRAPRAIKEIKEYVRRHMAEKDSSGIEDETLKKDVWIDHRLNEQLWRKGIENPPRNIRVKVIRFEDGLIEVSLPEE